MIDLTNSQTRERDAIATINREGLPRLAFARVSQNVAVAATLLDTLPAPSANGVVKVYRQ
jgi:hypothetical protein